MAKTLKLALSVALALVAMNWLAPTDLLLSQRIVQGILVLAVSLWVADAVPAFAVGILIIFLSVVSLSFIGGAQFSIPILYKRWSSPVIFLLLGGLFLAEGVTIAGLDKQIVSYVLKAFGSKPQSLLLGLMATSAVLSMVMSDTATTALMMASLTPVIDRLGPKQPYTKALLLGIATAAAIGGIGTAIGLPPHAIAISALAAQNISIHWAKYGFPLAVFLVLIAWFIIVRSHRMPPEVIFEIPDRGPETAVGGYKRNVTVVTVIVTLALWLTTPFHGFHVAAIAALPIVIFALTGVVGPAEVKQISWDTLMLVAGGLTLGEALNRTGLAGYYIQRLDLANVSPFLVILVFGYLCVCMSNFMSNTGTAALLVPVGIKLLPGHALEIAVTTGLCASFAVLLPVSTPPNAIVFSTGYLKPSDFRRTGIVVGVVGPLLTLLYFYSV